MPNVIMVTLKTGKVVPEVEYVRTITAIRHLIKNNVAALYELIVAVDEHRAPSKMAIKVLKPWDIFQGPMHHVCPAATCVIHAINENGKFREITFRKLMWGQGEILFELPHRVEELDGLLPFIKYLS